MTQMTKLAAAVVTMTLAHVAFAAVPADEAKQLGSTLTQFGAEKAGNKEGTIPAYSGKAPKAPASYDAKQAGQRPDPYGDKPLFSITAQNADKYADKLDNMLELFKKYPNFRMDVYPSRRDYVYPKYVLDNTLKNAAACKGAKDELKLEGCYGGFPFPVPKTGKQVMWNHLLQYGAYAYSMKTSSWVTPNNGKGVLQNITVNNQQYPFYDPNNTKVLSSDMVYWSNLQEDLAPARKAGGKISLQDSLDMVDVGRRVYQYIPGQRRVKLAPNLAYDTPSPVSGGAATMDDVKVFMGGLDRYDFKLVGKKEKFIQYNNFDLMNIKACSTEKLVNNPGFPHPDCVRWELHRVWKIEATLKPEFRHIYAKRIFYFDEDVPGAGTAENFDASGKLFRIVTAIGVPFYDGEKGGGGNYDTNFMMDLQSGLWAASGSSAIEGGGIWTTEPFESRIFTPDAMIGTGVR